MVIDLMEDSSDEGRSPLPKKPPVVGEVPTVSSLVAIEPLIAILILLIRI